MAAPGSCTDLLSLELEAVMDQDQAALPSSRREARAFNRGNLSRAVGDAFYYSQSWRRPLPGRKCLLIPVLSHLRHY